VRIIGELVIVEGTTNYVTAQFALLLGQQDGRSSSRHNDIKKNKRTIFSGSLLKGREKEEGTNGVHCTKRDSVVKYVGLEKPCTQLAMADKNVTSHINP
jgi:hypothetical protein